MMSEIVGSIRARILPVVFFMSGPTDESSLAWASRILLVIVGHLLFVTAAMFACFLPFLVLGLSRLVAADISTCLFHLCSVDASNNLTVGQLPGGQLQGSKLTESATWFRLYNGRLLDQALRGCWWASPTTVLVCDVPFSDAEEPDQLFSVTTQGDDQALTYNGTLSFYACKAGRYDKVNYYLKQPYATCYQVFLYIDPDMACFSEPFFTTSTTAPFSFSTPVLVTSPSIPEETITTDILSTVLLSTTDYLTTSETLPTPSSPPSTYTNPRSQSHSLSTIDAPLSTITLSPALPSFSTSTIPFPPFINSTFIPPLASLTAPAASDSLSSIPFKSFTGIFSWTNSTGLAAPSTATKSFSPGGVSGQQSYRPMTTTHITPATLSRTGTGGYKSATTTTVATETDHQVATTLVFHTEREKGSGGGSGGPVVATFTVTGEEGAVVTFAVEVEGDDL
ncbi:hypothetical protein B0T21DRAFT_356280 [Apiosordaria backusii]|uniref:Uncharacterized protein n=1 Tax=Apiosordaria backusii TaxID=314023 RepID=A0AA40K716_9PEZI|nr:hypothetical protein B0T21DRAFT_356280 [Apiosordaria backusii]